MTANKSVCVQTKWYILILQTEKKHSDYCKGKLKPALQDRLSHPTSLVRALLQAQGSRF